jgi:hypothetical protein
VEDASKKEGRGGKGGGVHTSTEVEKGGEREKSKLRPFRTTKECTCIRSSFHRDHSLMEDVSHDGLRSTDHWVDIIISCGEWVEAEGNRGATEEEPIGIMARADQHHRQVVGMLLHALRKVPGVRGGGKGSG